MTWWQAILLGVLQGLTEFLPVSSSGHLALVQLLLPGFAQPGVLFDALLHLGTAAAVVWFEWRQIWSWLSGASGLRIAVHIVAATAVTAAVAFPLKELAEAAFTSAVWVGVGLLVTGVVLLLTRLAPLGSSDERSARLWQSLAVGLAQGVAVFPGVSRSGCTIAAGLGVGLERAWAARFSFLLSVPAVAGAAAVEAFQHRDTLLAADSSLTWCFLGALVAGVTGYFALKLVLAIVQSRHLHRFAWYCLPLGLLVLLFVLGGGR